MASNSQQSIVLSVDWTEPAKARVQMIPDEPRFNGDVISWHEMKVREHTQQNVPAATRARIR